MSIEESNNQIIELLVAGKTTKEIAAALFLHTRTVETRLRRMREKYKVITTLQLVLKITQEKRITETHIPI